jgi:hypothetical protein
LMDSGFPEGIAAEIQHSIRPIASLFIMSWLSVDLNGMLEMPRVDPVMTPKFKPNWPSQTGPVHNNWRKFLWKCVLVCLCEHLCM